MQTKKNKILPSLSTSPFSPLTSFFFHVRVCWYLISVQLFLAPSCFVETVLFFLQINTTKKTAFDAASFLL